MAAGQAAQCGAEVLLLEKMGRLGRKLSITGHGRCNLTHAADRSAFLAHYRAGEHFLRPASYRFFNRELRAFFDRLGVPTTVEPDGRVFPATDRASDVVDALERWIDEQGVAIRTDTRVRQLLLEEGRIIGVEAGDTSSPSTYGSDAVILASGGASYPATGSTGDGYHMAASVGHPLVPLRPALVPLETPGDVAPRLQGVSLRDVAVRTLIEGDKEGEFRGDVLFTHFGLSGPAILSLSHLAVGALRQGQEVALSIDLQPTRSHPQLDDYLLRELDQHGKQHLRTLLQELLPAKLTSVVAERAGVPPHKPAHQITSEERKRLRMLLKDFRLPVSGHRPLAEAMVTAGGVDTHDIDPHTMGSRLVEGLYFAGEVLNIDGDTGGFNLQAAFSTGWLAGRSAAGSS
jgi:hypothetical protein